MQKLFDLDSEHNVEPGATASLRMMCRTGPSLPLSLLCQVETLEAFAIEDVSVGCCRVLLMAKTYAPADLKRPENFLPELLHVGMDFSIQALNRSEEPIRFRCEVWGLRKVRAADWEPVALDLRSRALGVLACVRCERCGKVLRIKAGDRIPDWCPNCIEDWAGFGTDEEENSG